VTKTEAKRKVAEMRRAARRVTDALTPTPAWILRETGQSPPHPATTTRIIATALDEVERLSAELRRGLVP
jgi:hypothetical protein